MDQKRSVSVSRSRQPQPHGRLPGDPPADFAVVLDVALAQVVDQQRQVQQRACRLIPRYTSPRAPSPRQTPSRARPPQQCSSTVYL